MFQDVFELFGNAGIFITGTITIILNIILIMRGTNWVVLLLFNVILSVIMNIIGLENYDLLSVLITRLATILWDLVKSIIDAIFMIKPFNL